MRYYFTINNLFQHFEALWSKILPPDLKPFVYFFFVHPLVRVSRESHTKAKCFSGQLIHSHEQKAVTGSNEELHGAGYRDKGVY